MSPVHAAFDKRNWLLAPPRIAISSLGVGAGNGVDTYVAKLLVEETVIRTTAKFAVGCQPQAKLLLQYDRVRNRGIFRCRQIRLRNLSMCEAFTLLQES
jgi:hypothetical protein